MNNGNRNKVSLITPTGDRPEAFALCERWMARQSVPGNVFEWIVVDDGDIPTPVRMGQTYVRREKSTNDPRHTLGPNLLEGLSRVTGDYVLIIEDDEYYAPEYVDTMVSWLKHADLVGEVGAKYYYLSDRLWKHHNTHKHASLCRTGFARKVIPTLQNIVSVNMHRSVSFDIMLWKQPIEKKSFQSSHVGASLCIGIKQMPGRTGALHGKTPSGSIQDPSLQKLKEWIPNDWKYYQQYTGSDDKLVYYTCLFGEYDTLGEAPDPNRSYVITDNHKVAGPGWKPIVVSSDGQSPRHLSRRYKMLPHTFFSDATLYFDANLTPKSRPDDPVSMLLKQSASADILGFRHQTGRSINKEAVEVVKLGFADPSQAFNSSAESYSNHPVCLGGILLRKNTESAKRFGEEWWRLWLNKSPNRDQLIMPEALEKSHALYYFHGDNYRNYFSERPHVKPRQKS